MNQSTAQLIQALNLHAVAKNPMQGADFIGAKLFSSLDNKMHLSVVSLERSSATGKELMTAAFNGMRLVKMSSLFDVEIVKTREELPEMADMAWVNQILASEVGYSDVFFSVMRDPFKMRNIEANAFNTTIVTADEKWMISLTVMVTNAEVSSQLAADFLDGAIVAEVIAANDSDLHHIVEERRKSVDDMLNYIQNECGVQTYAGHTLH